MQCKKRWRSVSASDMASDRDSTDKCLCVRTYTHEKERERERGRERGRENYTGKRGYSFERFHVSVFPHMHDICHASECSL